jgi:hypothetical protein
MPSVGEGSRVGLLRALNLFMHQRHAAEPRKSCSRPVGWSTELAT